MDLNGKNAVVTGGIGGIGLAIAKHLLKNGIQRIALLDLEYRDDVIEKLRETFPGKVIIFHLTDVSDKRILERVFKEVMSKFKSIDCIIACAGVLDEQNYELTVEVNLLGLIHTNYIAMQYMTKEAGNNGGLIVNISSVTGIDCSQFSSPVYNASKHGVVAFTRSMGDQFFYDKTGIKFITVCPGVTQTEFLEDLDKKLITIEAYESTNKKLNHALKQTVNEFAVAFIDVLKEDKNGAVWLIDGGKFKEITYTNPWYDGIQSRP